MKIPPLSKITSARCIGNVGYFLLSALVASAGATRPTDRFYRLPMAGSPASQEALLLAVDAKAFPMMLDLTLHLTKPNVRRDPVLVPSTNPDAPDSKAVHFNGTVIRENGRFRMWYYAFHSIPTDNGQIDGEFGISPICYAESSDGLSWTRPDLGQVEWRGNRRNNIIAIGPDPARGSNCVTVIRDDEEPRPEQRYKMAFGFQDTELKISRIGAAVSPDGLRWTRLANDVTGKSFGEIGGLYKHGGNYVVNAQSWGRGEGERPQGRTGYAWISPDFDTWLPEPAPSFKVAEPLVGSGMGTNPRDGGNYTQVHLGVGGASYGNVVVGLWGMWHNRQPNWGEGGIDCDLGLVLSHNGIQFEEVVKGVPYIRSVDSPADPVPGRSFPTVLNQSNSILNVGDETWIYHGRWRNTDFQPSRTRKQFHHRSVHYWGAVALATIPRDRWGGLAISVGKDSGSLWSTAVTLPAGIPTKLGVNGSGLKGFRIEVADEHFRPIAGFADGRAISPTDDHLESEVRWSGRTLGELSGRTVRIRTIFTGSSESSPRLYAMKLSPAR